jgi:hypothetical protein
VMSVNYSGSFLAIGGVEMFRWVGMD